MKRSLIGPGHQDSDVFLGRTIRWTDVGLEWEANTKHVKMLLDHHKMTTCKPMTTPVTMEQVSLDDTQSGEPLGWTEARQFRGSVARINYLAQDRPDLSLAACVLSTRMANPRRGDEVVLKRVLRYLRGRSCVAMVYHWQAPCDELVLMTDSDWATCHRTRRSKSGGVLLRGRHVIQFWCKMQDRIALSSAEAELKAVCKGYAELIHMRNIIEFLCGTGPKLVSNTDASACKGIMLRQGSGPVKHLSIRQLWVQEAVHEYNIDVRKLNRAENLADFLCSPGKEALHVSRLQEFGCEDRYTDST